MKNEQIRNRNGSMEKNTSFPVDFSDSFFDAFDNADIDAVDDSDFSVKQPSGGIDILKQSLQAANITADDSLGFGGSFADYCFDDNGSSANLTLDLDSADNNNQQHQQDPFDTSQFLNLGNETKPSSTFQSSSVGSRPFSSNTDVNLTNNLASNNNVTADSASSHHAAPRIQMEDGDEGFHKNFNNQTEIAGSSSNRNVSSLYGTSSNNLVQVRQQPIQVPVSYASNNQTRQHVISKQTVKITNDPNNPSRPIYQVSNQSVRNKSIVVVQGGEQKVVNLQTLNIVSSPSTNTNQSAHSGGQQQNNFTVVLPNNATSGGTQKSKAVWTINNNQNSSVSQNALDRNAGTAKSQLTAKYQGNYPTPSSNNHSPRIVATATSKQQLSSQVKAQYYITNLPAHLPTSNTNTRTSSSPVALRPIKNLQANKPRTSGFVGMRIASVNIPISASSSSTTNQTSVVNGTVASTKVGVGVDKQRQVISVHSKPSSTDKPVNKYVFDRPRTPDKPRQVSKPQLQKLLSQQPATKPPLKTSEASQFDPTKTIRKVWNGSQYTTVATTTNMTQVLDKQRSGSRSSHLTFRVDPGLTLSQIDEVQKNIRERSNNHKSFNPQQKQLQSAFWAHIHSMEVTVQEYYIRNPQLFTQKVHHHFVKTKKPFFVVVKSPSSSLLLTSSAAAAANFTSNKADKSNNHPTISLTGSNNRTKSPIPKLRVNDHSVKTAVKRAINSSSIPCIKQEYEDLPIVPLKRPSMIQEQMEAHRKMVLQPDTVTPFKNIRDCVRRLLPYHVYNVPEVKKEDFEESEILFQKIADRSYTTMHKMFAKYHQLFLKDTVREVSSPDAVMLDRIFLQDEKQKLILEKQQIHDDPLQLTKYLRMDNERERKLAEALKDEARRKSEEAQRSSEVVVVAAHNQQQPQQHHHGSESEALALQQAVNSIL